MALTTDDQIEIDFRDDAAAMTSLLTIHATAQLAIRDTGRLCAAHRCGRVGPSCAASWHESGSAGGRFCT